MRLPGDATLVVLGARGRDAETDEGERRLIHMRTLEIAWQRAGLPVIRIECAGHGTGGASAGAAGDGTTLRMSGDDFFLGSGLEDLLTRRGATTVVLCGFLGEPGG